jgi:catechol 2,3-dioxygenase-like lactoylglutathione lyase family enzyme
VLDHVSLNVESYDASKAFYTAALAPLGIGLLMEFGAYCGFGRDGRPFFWIGERPPLGGSTHVAFTAPDRATVDAFHTAALAVGGRDNGAPGLRPQYHATYYAAFVHDPDGNNVEAVCHRPE